MQLQVVCVNDTASVDRMRPVQNQISQGSTELSERNTHGVWMRCQCTSSHATIASGTVPRGVSLSTFYASRQIHGEH